MSAKRKTRLTVLAAIVGLLALLGYVVRSELVYARLKDPTGFTTIADFYSRFGTTTNTTAITIASSETLVSSDLQQSSPRRLARQERVFFS